MTNQPKLWKDMTDAEKGALLLAVHEGAEIDWNCQVARGGGWAGWATPYAYRVKPKAPKVETFSQKAHVWRAQDGRPLTSWQHPLSKLTLANITHTYTITDGRVTACDTIIHDNKEK
jgi:hypothetical protein